MGGGGGRGPFFGPSVLGLSLSLYFQRKIGSGTGGGGAGAGAGVQGLKAGGWGARGPPPPKKKAQKQGSKQGSGKAPPLQLVHLMLDLNTCHLCGSSLSGKGACSLLA